MIEIRFHGRGGQGTVVGSGILGLAFFYEGYQVQFFPEFGVERRGAPLQAFLRASDTKIRSHYNIYSPHHIVLFDSTLINVMNVTEGLQEGGWVLVNTKKQPSSLGIPSGFKTAAIDADGISLEHRLGSPAAPIINAAMSGAFAGMSGFVSLDSVLKAVRESVPAKIEENVEAARKAYKSVITG